ncbi:cupin domain-containing protein [Corynebacterium suranareeae]|uniref:Cupin domain-containing protein n=1 Tax=Corynebacterium suranareeae TaxID=2506452 RepID=A0A160PTE1_9CORY|nr:cupin domain-containing protein [Corynebacterium suranareeae]BAU97056.1 cupin domain-containing protein [Corynebacterium suranareeae]
MSESIEPMSSVNISERADELMEKAAQAHSGRATHVFRAIPKGSLSQVLLALRKDHELSEHENPGEALLHVLKGRVRLVVGDQSIDLGEDDHVVIPQHHHSLIALEDAAVFLTVVIQRPHI